MRILLSAFSFAPHQGSEPGVGWRWALELARDHQVVVLTDETRRAAAEAELRRNPQAGLSVVYYRPRWLRRMPLNSNTAQLLYALWQFGLPRLARRLHAEHGFDLVIHVTYGVFRHASLLGGIGVPFIFGPLGGGENAPMALKRSIRGRERAREVARTALNHLALLDPTLWWAYAHADLILVKTEQTRQALPWPYRHRAVVFPEVGIDALDTASPAPRVNGEPLRALFAGRLLGWKGAHLALIAISLARGRGIDVRLDVVGRGPYEATLRALRVSLGLVDAVRFVGHVPQETLFAMYARSHVFVFPSLHDSSGNVVLEAQAFGCPVICLDIGGPATLVSPQSAHVVPTVGAREAEIVERLADALANLFHDEPRRTAMSRAALAQARAMTWASRVRCCLALARQRGLINGATQ